MKPISFSNFSLLDWVILFVFLASSFWGLYRGFIRDFFGLLAWFGAFWGLGKYADSMQVWWNHQQLPQAKILVPILIFLFSLIGFNVIGMVFSRVAKKADMVVLDTVCGFFGGFFRGFIISVALIAILSNTDFSGKVFFKNSVLRHPIESTFSKFFPNFESDLSMWVKNNFGKNRKKGRG